MTQNRATEFKISATGNYVPSAKITSSIDAANYAKQFYSDDISVYESAFIILLNQASKVIGWAKIAQGGLAATIVDIRIVAKYAIDSLAANVVFVHNHPSGNLRSSMPDDTLTRRLKEGLALLDVTLMDSIILSPEGGYFSYADEGRL